MLIDTALTLGLLAEALPVTAPLVGSPIKWAGMLVLSFAWLLTCPRLNQDAMNVRINRPLWSGLYLGAGALGLLLWVVIPIYALGLLAFLLVVASMGAIYIAQRNGRVEDDDAKLTISGLLRGITGSGGPRVHHEKVTTHLKLYSSDGRSVMLAGEHAADPEEVRGYNAAQNLLYDIARNRASEVDLSPAGEQHRLRYVIDGVVSERPPVPAEQARLAIDYLEQIGSIDEPNKSNPMKGKVSVDLADQQIDMDVTTATTKTGRRLQVRVIQEVVQTNLDLLGMDDGMKQAVLDAIEQPGLLIVSGPPKQGTTSTLFSILRKQDAYMKMLMTIEDKATIELENVTQNDYDEPARLPEVIAASARRDPDILMVDQCPDTRTAKTLIDFTQEKTALLGMRASDVFSALSKWLTVVGSASGIQPVRGILCQLLLRKLCPACRVAYTPEPALLKKMKIDPSRVDALYRPPKDKEKPRDKQERIIPCQTCQDVGYFGRTAVFEYLGITDDLRKAVLDKTPLAQVRGLARNLGFRSLKDNALAKVIDGTTSLQEVVRVFQADKPRK